MSNHFHLLVEVPQRPAQLPPESWLWEHIGGCFGQKQRMAVQEQVKQYREAGAHEAAERVVAGWYSRMWDLSSFMKTLKQRFTQWFNKQYERKGTLWEDRFRSTIVEGGPAALAIVAAYVDLNPVRAGLVTDPKDYLWSGYGAAVAGERRALSGVESLASLMDQKVRRKGEALASYRVILYGAGDEGDDTSIRLRREGGPRKRGFHHQEVEEVRRQEGRLPLREVLRCRVRYFTAGAVIGSREFVNAVFDSDPGRFGRNRIEGARPMRGGDFLGLCSLRDLRTAVISSPHPEE
jgi:REP element-mobilizing transposase RayT